jgi:ATPase subunit of ABC transporter with duplicated ATPase domains
MPLRRGRPGLMGTMARTAVAAGTATAVSGSVSRRGAQRAAEQQQAAAYQQQQQAAAEQQAMVDQAAAQAAAEAAAGSRRSRQRHNRQLSDQPRAAIDGPADPAARATPGAQ